jgi:hypothetical protein
MVKYKTLWAHFNNYYSQSNQTYIHGLALVTIFWGIFALLFAVKLPFYLQPDLPVNVALLATVFLLIFYYLLANIGHFSLALVALTMALWSYYGLEESGYALWVMGVLAVVFGLLVLIMVHQKASQKILYLQDLQYLLVAPLHFFAKILHFIEN